LTGAIVKILNKYTYCHVIFRSKNDRLDPNYDSPENDGGYKYKVKEIIKSNNIKVFLDIHGASESRDFDIDIGTDNENALKGHDFLIELIRVIMTKNNIFNVKHNSVFAASYHNTITNYTHLNTGIPCLQIEINKKFRNIEDVENVNNIFTALKEIIKSLKDIDFNNNKIYLYTTKKSNKHIPLDKLEFCEADVEKLNLVQNDSVQIEPLFKDGFSDSLFSIYRKPPGNLNLQENKIYLTNRFYKHLIEETNGESYEFKVLVYRTKKNVEAIGLPKAGEDIVKAGSELFEKLDANKKYKLYNRIDGIDINIGHIGIKTDTTLPDRIFLNYFQRHLMNVNTPKKVIMKSEFDFYVNNSSNILNESEIEILKDSYEYKIGFYEIKIEELNNIKLKNICKKLDLDKIEIVELRDKIVKKKSNLIKRYYKRLKNFVLKKLVNNIPISMRVGRPLPTDETSDIVRLMPDTMKILGIEDTDRVVIKRRDKEIRLRAMSFDSLEIIKWSNVLVFDEMDAFVLIGIPARYRVELDIFSLNSIVSVERDMSHIFNKNLSIQLMPIIAVVFTVFQTFSDSFIRAVLNIILIPVAMYLALSQERVKVSKEKRNIW
jgi:hypothetical protein